MIVAVYRHAEQSEQAQHRLRRRRSASHRWPMSPFRSWQRTELRADILNDALDGDLLSVRERCAIALTFLGNCSARDAARLLNDSEAAVFYQISTAVRRLHTLPFHAEPRLR